MAGAPRARSPALWLGLLVVAGHLALTAHFVSLRAIFADAPIDGDDFDLHIGQTFRVLEGLEGWGRSWVYDVALLAGEPAGVIVDSGNKGWSLWTYALTRLGLGRGAAFNTFILLSHLLPPLCVFLCARAFELRSAASLLAAGLASLFWFFDSFSHWVWWVGMCSYATAASFALLPLALFRRFVERGRRWAALLCGPALGLALLIHPYSFFILVVPMGHLYLRRARVLSPLEHGLVAGIALASVAINAYWLLNALAHWHYILNSAYFGQTGPAQLLADFFSVLRDPTDTGVIGNRTGFRFLLLGLAVAGALGARRRGDDRLAPLHLALVALILLAYLGSYLPGGAQIQPYRHVLPAGFIACIVGAAFVERLLSSGALRGLSIATRALLVVACLAATQHLSRDVLYFMPHLVPEAPPLIDGSRSPIGGYGYLTHFERPEHMEFRIPHAPFLQQGIDAAVDWVDEHVRAGERIVVDNAVLGERVAWKTDVEVLGGFRERNIAHAYANFFRRFGDEQVGPELLSEYVRTYAVRHFVLREPRRDLHEARDVLRHRALPIGVHVYSVIEPGNKLLSGHGLVSATTNRIAVSGSDPNVPLLLSYHYHEALRCRPDCRMQRADMRLDEVGFIQVPAPHPADLVIENAYP